ncbi:hypothetical protein N656DRAFT_705738, partial [Canariomyces notabilis]
MPCPTNGRAGDPPLLPTARGFIADGMDACALIMACVQGRYRAATRRPREHERERLVVSGNIFVYKRDKNTNLTRWTDGVNWSPSRLQGPFIFYREIQDPPQGHRKNNKAKNPNAIANPNSDREALRLRPFIAALYDTYMFKPGGLIKKSFAGKVGNDDWHVVAYYTLQDLPNLHRVRALDPHL